MSAQQVLTWDAEGHLASVTEGTDTSTYLYDALGNRLITRDATGTTLHLPGGMEVNVNPSGGNATGTRVYAHAGQTIATRTTADGLTWLFVDHQKTATIAVRDSDMAVSRRYQTPYGTQRGPASAWPTQHGYLNGFQDESGLTHLGAREYDPAAGRFISDDPVTDVADPQQINGHTYANASPVSNMDPTGLRVCIDVDCTKTYVPKANTKPVISEPPKTMGQFLRRLVLRQTGGVTSELTEVIEVSTCSVIPDADMCTKMRPDPLDNVPFTCSVMPDAELCETDFDTWFETYWTYIELGVTACFAFTCVSIEIQSGVLHASVGAKISVGPEVADGDVAVQITVHAEAYQQQSSIGVEACVLVACVGADPVGTNAHVGGSVDLMPSFPELSANVTYTYFSIVIDRTNPDFGTVKFYELEITPQWARDTMVAVAVACASWVPFC